jgi:hypothetical protein
MLSQSAFEDRFFRIRAAQRFLSHLPNREPIALSPVNAEFLGFVFGDFRQVKRLFHALQYVSLID